MANSETAADLQAEEAISGDFCLSFFLLLFVFLLGKHFTVASNSMQSSW